MENNNITIQESFDSTLKDTDLKGIAIDITELALDSIIKDPTVQSLPIVGTVIGITKLGANIHDKLFLKKIISFLNGLKNVSVEDRNKIIKEIDESKKYRVKVGEKLLYIIDSCNDFENSERVANVFKFFVNGKISYDDFLKTSNVLQKITNYDLQWFLNKAKDFMNSEDVRGLIGSGLFDLEYEPVDVRVDDEDDYKKLRENPNSSKYKAEVDGGGINITLSRVGNIIMDIFGSREKKKTLKL